MTPWVSQRMTLSWRTPIALTSSVQAMPAAPAPLTTSLTSRSERPVSSSALIRPAAAMMAVPCWSSWKTGMSSSSRRRCSMMKHSGALMSSRLMPPKVGPSSRTQSTNSSTSLVSTSRSIDVDVGEALEEDGLALHHRLRRRGRRGCRGRGPRCRSRSRPRGCPWPCSRRRGPGRAGWRGRGRRRRGCRRATGRARWQAASWARSRACRDGRARAAPAPARRSTAAPRPPTATSPRACPSLAPVPRPRRCRRLVGAL